LSSFLVPDGSRGGIMNNARIATIVAWIAVVVLVAHGIRAWVSQARWVTGVVEIVAAGVMAWVALLLSRGTEPAGASKP
jgi:threonine/homoserine/homoserine lactone efflux protein